MKKLHLTEADLELLIESINNTAYNNQRRQQCQYVQLVQ